MGEFIEFVLSDIVGSEIWGAYNIVHLFLRGGKGENEAGGVAAGFEKSSLGWWVRRDRPRWFLLTDKQIDRQENVSRSLIFCGRWKGSDTTSGPSAC